MNVFVCANHDDMCMFVESRGGKTLYEKMEKMSTEKACLSSGCSGPKFQTLCGHTFDTNLALAEFLGVHVSAISHATGEARAKGRLFFECGKPIKRSIRIIQPHVLAPDERELQTDENPTNPANPANPDNATNPTKVDFSTFAYTSSHASMKAMQVHTHMQAAALKLFPDRKLLLLNCNPKIRNTNVAIVKAVNSDAIKFDVAETWMLHAYESTQSLLSFIKKVEALLVSSAESTRVNTEGLLFSKKYPSLIFDYYTNYSDLKKLVDATEQIAGHKRAFMNAEDMLIFLQQHTTLFEHNTTQSFDDTTQSIDNTTKSMVQKQHQSTQTLGKQTFAQHKSAEDEFMTICCEVMKNVENSLQERSCLLSALDTGEKEVTKKRKYNFAADSIRNMTSILFAANKLLYSDSQRP